MQRSTEDNLTNGPRCFLLGPAPAEGQPTAPAPASTAFVRGFTFSFTLNSLSETTFHSVEEWLEASHQQAATHR